MSWVDAVYGEPNNYTQFSGDIAKDYRCKPNKEVLIFAEDAPNGLCVKPDPSKPIYDTEYYGRDGQHRERRLYNAHDVQHPNEQRYKKVITIGLDRVSITPGSIK